MIRKPDAREFRESDAVLRIRDAGTVAREGARGIGEGTARFVGRGFAVLLGLGFLLSMARHLGPLAILFTSAGALAMFLRGTHRDTSAAAFAGTAKRGDDAGGERYELSVGAVARKAGVSAVLAILCFPTRTFFYMLPVGLAAVVVVAMTMLSLARLVGDRAVLRFDASSITVGGLLGPATMLWEDVADVQVRKASFLNLRARFASGSRHNLVVSGERNRLGGSKILYVPIDLLDLNGPARAGLVSRLIARQGGTPRPAGERAASRPRPRSETTESPEPAAFDPDAIIERYMAERQQAQPLAPPKAPAAARPVFGRKVA